MISDSIPNASIAMASANPKDFAKKKRANRSAKLKQCKLDARREQWLSQVKNKGGCKDEVNGGAVAHGGPPLQLVTKSSRSIEKLEKIKTKCEDEIYGEDGSLMNHFSDSESLPSNSPTSHTSSVLGSNDSGLNFTASSRSSISSISSSGRSSSSSSNCFCTGNMSEEDEEGDADVEDDCLDDWEAVADALAASDKKQQQEHTPNTGSGLKNHENAIESGTQVGVGPTSATQESGGTAKERSLVNCCAWRPDDACRPQSLPNLAKQYSFPLNSERHLGSRGAVWACKNLGPTPTSCPICFEDLDCTDSSFVPCSCGFRLCLFCHKRILEEDGRCPGCRKQYEFEPLEGEAMVDGGSLTFRLGLTRSCSMITRS